MSDEILLISPPYQPEGRKAVPPLGIASLGGFLEENGHRGRVGLIDGFSLARKYGLAKSLDMTRKRILEDKPFVVGCTALYTNETEASEIMKTARDAGSHVIVGGHQATLDHISYSKLATAVVRGEGELTAKELIDALFEGQDLDGIRGITYCKGADVFVNPRRELADLNGLPPPAYHLLPSVDEYDLMLIEESRGCFFRCSFCSIAEMYPSFRLKSPERIRIDVETVVELGTRDIELIGELVLLNESRAMEIAEIMNEFGCGWRIDGHPELVLRQRRVLPELARKGLKVIEIGVESANQRSLDVYDKQTTPKKNVEAVQAILSAGMFPLIDFINFEPYIRMEDLAENIRFIMRFLRLLSKAPSYPLENIFKPWIPIPGTRLFEKANSEGLLVSAESSGTSASYPRMANAQHFIRFRDEDVQRVVDLIDRFLKGYGERYYRMIGQLIREDTVLSESPRAEALAVVPAYVLCMAYAVVKSRIPGERIIDWYGQQRLDAIEKGQYDRDVSSPALPLGSWAKINSVFQDLAPSKE